MKSPVLLILLVFIVFLDAQAEKIKFKAITKKEMNVDKCDFYPEAKAVILTKRGEIDFDISTNGLIYRYSEAARIKILDDNEKDAGNVSIRLYSPENNMSGPREKITHLSGFTYIMENGNIEKIKLEKANIYNNRLNKYWIEVNFVLPNVKKGAVIEYSYMKESSYFENLHPWLFQSKTPTIYCELTYTIPEYFDFQTRMMGNLHDVEHKEEWVTDNIGGLSFRSRRVNMKAKNLPPVEEEPFVSNPCDLPLRMEFQLVTVDIPGQPIMRIAGSYAQFNKQLLEIDPFWKAATRGSFPKELSSAVAGMNDKEKAVYLFEWMKEAIAWNKMEGIIQSKSLRESLKDKSGSVADINLALTSLFRSNGLEAYPIILSSRGNGVVHPVYPSFDDFNYVISAVKIDDTFCFADATARVPLGLLPPRCLNGSGWLVSEQGGRLIPLKGSGGTISAVFSTIAVKDGNLEVEVVTQDKEYAALQTVEEYTQAGAEKYEEKLQAKYPDWTFSDYKFEPGEGNVKQQFKLIKPCDRTDILYIQPFLYGLASEPLFKRDSRQAVVDFPYGMQQTISTTIQVPEGYEVDQLPEEDTYLLTNKGALFTFKALAGIEQVTITITFIMKKLTYTSLEYPELKDFFEEFAKLSKTVIVFKKKQSA